MVADVAPTSAARPTAIRFVFDVLCAAGGLILLSPLLVLIGIAIKLDDGGPIFYRQSRVGKRFRLFRVLKFRSMVCGADGSGLVTAPGDPRVTRVGRVLRKWKLDELPQLINVLKGEMQLVGARPEVGRYVAMFRQQYSLLLEDRPGITDPATIAYRHEDEILQGSCLEEQYVSKVLPDKLRLSIEYHQCRRFGSDIAILLRTVLGLP
jgi:lipopolysaccharide/colanic/teichoic acid biosynthesis glycosyltransferase